jgi:hypothetical protein
MSLTLTANMDFYLLAFISGHNRHTCLGETAKCVFAYQQLCLYQEVNIQACMCQHLYTICESDFKDKVKEMISISMYYPFHDSSYH